MFIKSVKATNFRGLKEAEFVFGESPFVLLAAPNGVGKTSLIDAIEWCLTGSIGRLKNSFDARSTNSAERKINVDGILKHKDAGEDDCVRVEICVRDGNQEYRISRKQKKDELDYSGREQEVWVNGVQHTEGDWLDRCINRNFYNFHFCDIQKSIGIQSEKRESLSQKFREFITDYSAQKEVAENLLLFQRDVGLRVEKKNQKRLGLRILKENIEETLKKLADRPDFLEYPAVPLYDGELTEFQGLDQQLLKKQQAELYACGYAYAAGILKERIENQKNRERCRKAERLLQLCQEKMGAIAQAIEAGLDQEAECVQALDEKLDEYREMILGRSTILEHGPELAAFQNAGFSMQFFQEKKAAIEALEREIRELEETIETLSEGNEVIQALSALVNWKQELSQYREVRMQAEGKVLCPVCGSDRFARIETEAILQEASDYLAVSAASLEQKTQEKNRRKQTQNDLYEELVQAGKKVLSAEIQKVMAEKEKLQKLQEDTSEFFALQKVLSSEVQISDDILWWCDAANLMQLVLSLQEKQLSEEAAESMKQEAEAVLNLVGFHQNTADSDQSVLERIREYAASAPKLMNFSRELLVGKLNALSYQIQDREFAECSQRMRYCQEQIRQLEGEVRELQQLQQLAGDHAKEIKGLIQQLTHEEYRSVGPSLYKFYKKLSRINTIQDIKIILDETEDQVSLTDESGKHMVNILSNGQLSVFILAYFFAGIVSRGNGEAFRVYFIDDLTSCMDDVNMLSFLDLLKYLLKDSRNPIDQLFFATCDERIEKLLCYKMDGSEIPYTKLVEADFPKH